MKKIVLLGSFILLLAACSNPSGNEQSKSIASTTENTQKNISETMAKSTETTSGSVGSETQPKSDALAQLRVRQNSILTFL